MHVTTTFSPQTHFSSALWLRSKISRWLQMPGSLFQKQCWLCYISFGWVILSTCCSLVSHRGCCSMQSNKVRVSHRTDRSAAPPPEGWMYKIWVICGSISFWSVVNTMLYWHQETRWVEEWERYKVREVIDRQRQRKRIQVNNPWSLIRSLSSCQWIFSFSLSLSSSTFFALCH